MELILVRHALPVRARGVNGAAADPGLADEGREQARRLAHWLGAERIDAICASPAARAWETAQPLAALTGSPVRVVEALREFDTGADEYVPVEELRAANDPRWQALARGEFYGAVDPEAFRRRVVEGVEELVAAHPGERVVAFTHAGAVNVYTGHVLGIERPMWFAPGYTSISRIGASRDGRRGLLSLNEAPHLHPAHTSSP